MPRLLLTDTPRRGLRTHSSAVSTAPRSGRGSAPSRLAPARASDSRARAGRHFGGGRRSAAPRPRRSRRAASPRDRRRRGRPLDQRASLGRRLGRQAEAEVDRGKQPLLDRLVVLAEHRLERRDHVADHVFGRVVQQGGEPPRGLEPRLAGAAIASTTSECWATEKACAPRVWPFQRATRARPWAMSSISMSSGEGSSRSSRRPGQHALPGAGRRLRAGWLHQRRSIIRARTGTNPVRGRREPGAGGRALGLSRGLGG